MCVSQGVFADLQGTQEHLFALLRIVGFKLLVGEAVVDCDGKRVVSTEVVA
jgi:hypothetical protein